MNDDARTGGREGAPGARTGSAGGTLPAAVARAGFTLLEIVIALTALALITVICYGAFHLGIRAMEGGEVAVVAAQRLRVATDVIIRQIKSIVPYKARNRDDEEYVFFMGTASSMAFITAAGLEGGGGLTRVVYQVMDDPPRLVMSESPFFSTRQLGREPVDQPGLHSAVLLDGFRALKFEYLFYEGVEPEWRTEWSARALAGMSRAPYYAQRGRDKAKPATPPGAVAGTGQGQGPRTLDEDEDDEPLVPVDGQWHEGDFAGGRWSVRMIDETGRISLNKADEVLLRRVITNLAQTDPTASMDRHTQEAIDTVVDSILDWRDHDNLKRTHGAE